MKDLDGDNVFGLPFSCEIDSSEFPPTQWFPDLEIIQRPLFPRPCFLGHFFACRSFISHSKGRLFLERVGLVSRFVMVHVPRAGRCCRLVKPCVFFVHGCGVYVLSTVV